MENTKAGWWKTAHPADGKEHTRQMENSKVGWWKTVKAAGGTV